MFGEWNAVVVPSNPVLDKIIALVIWIEQLVHQLEVPKNLEILYWRTNADPPSSVIAEWSAKRIYPIDLGPKKYHQVAGCGSASEVVCRDLKLDLNHRDNAEYARLVSIANKNNRTGWLKQMADQYNVPYLLRELYKPGMFAATRHIIEEAVEVVGAELRYRRMFGRRYVREWEDIGHCSALVQIRDTLPSYEVDIREIFTLKRVLMTMWCCGDDEQVIQRRMEFWMRAFRQAKAMREVAKRKADYAVVRTWDLNGHLCAHIKTDDDRIARVLFSRRKGAPSLILCERRNRSFVIVTNGSMRLDRYGSFRNSVASLFQHLRTTEREQGAVWFYDARIQAIFNGSRSLKDSVPTGWNAEHMVKAINNHVKLPGPPEGKEKSGGETGVAQLSTLTEGDLAVSAGGQS